jgi:hypothetical protein
MADIKAKKVLFKNRDGESLIPYIGEDYVKQEDMVEINFVPKDSMQEIPCIIETYINGDSWYRVWSDGWCEQGGMVNVIANNANVVVTFLKPMLNTDYTVTIGHYVASNTDAFYYNQGGVTNKTTQTVTLTNRRFQSNGSYTLNIMWQACGYIA